MTRWLYYLFDIWPLTAINFAQKYYKLTKVGWLFCHLLNTLTKIAKDFKIIVKVAKFRSIWPHWPKPTNSWIRNLFRLSNIDSVSKCFYKAMMPSQKNVCSVLSSFLTDASITMHRSRVNHIILVTTTTTPMMIHINMASRYLIFMIHSDLDLTCTCEAV